jgi:hypothetical protein
MVDEIVRRMVKRGELRVCIKSNRFRNDQTVIITTPEDAETRHCGEVLTGMDALGWLDDPALACGCDRFFGSVTVSPDATEAAAK